MNLKLTLANKRNLAYVLNNGIEQIVSKDKACEVCALVDVDLEYMPYCGHTICWDNCLYKNPKKCPCCGHKIRVIFKEQETKACYVQLK